MSNTLKGEHSTVTNEQLEHLQCLLKVAGVECEHFDLRRTLFTRSNKNHETELTIHLQEKGYFMGKEF